MRSPRRKAPSRQPTPVNEPQVDAIRDEMRTERGTRNRRVIAAVRMRRRFKKRGE